MVSLVTNLGLNLWLIPKYGINGSAIAFAVGIVADNGMTMLVVRFKLKVQPFGRGYAIVVAASTLCFGVLGLLVRQALGMTMVSFLSFGLVSTSLYLWVIWRFRGVLRLGFIRDALRSRGSRMRAGGPVR
jgi:O-antigen/teichoic acid export membrane protein